MGLISNDTILNVRNIPIIDVLGLWNIQVKKGVCLSPFVGEKTASCKVYEKTNTIKCYSSGIQANNITLVMKKEGLEFADSVKFLCEKFKIKLEYDSENEGAKEEKESFSAALSANSVAQNEYTKDCKASNDYWWGRGFNEETIENFGLGVSNFGFSIPLFGLGNNILGFAFRLFEGAKYVNPTDTVLYKKKNFLFNYYAALRHIKEKDNVFIVEGYADCFRLFQEGIKNVVAVCGTALTNEQIQLLKKATNKVCLFLDKDRAGVDATSKMIPLLLESGFEVASMVYPNDYNEGQKGDPDDYFYNYENAVLNVLCWSKYIPFATKEDLKTAFSYLQKIEDEIYKVECLESLRKRCDKNGITSGMFKAAQKSFNEDKEKVSIKEVGDLPVKPVEYDFKGVNVLSQGMRTIIKKWVFLDYKVKDFEKLDFCEWVLRVTEAKENGKTLFSLNITNDVLHDVRQLRKLFTPFDCTLDANEGQMSVFLAYLIEERKYKEAYILPYYCYNQWAKVWVFSNAVYDCENGVFLKEENGFYQKGKMYLKIFEDNDKTRKHIYEYKEGKLLFDGFAKLYKDSVPGPLGVLALSFAVSAFFRDIMIRDYGFSPHLYIVGPKGTGKTTILQVLTSLSGFRKDTISLKAKNSEKFLPRAIGQSSNTTLVFDEWRKENEGATNLMYAAYGNIGYGYAVGSGSKTETVQVRMSIMATSNDVPEDEILLDRCLIFPKRDTKKTDLQRDSMNAILKTENDAGLSSVGMDILKHRKLIESNYLDNFQALKKTLMKKFSNGSERLYSNVAAIFTPILVLQVCGKIKSITHDEIISTCVKVMEEHKNANNDSGLDNKLMDWIKSHFGAGNLIEGTHFKIKDENVIFQYPYIKYGFLQHYERRNISVSESQLKEAFSIIGQKDFEEIRIKSFHFRRKDNHTERFCSTGISLSLKNLLEKYDFSPKTETNFN